METFVKGNEIYVKLPRNKVAKLDEFVKRYSRGGQLEVYDFDNSFVPCDIKAEYDKKEAILSKIKSKKPNFFKLMLKFGKKDK